MTVEINPLPVPVQPESPTTKKKKLKRKRAQETTQPVQPQAATTEPQAPSPKKTKKLKKKKAKAPETTSTTTSTPTTTPVPTTPASTTTPTTTPEEAAKFREEKFVTVYDGPDQTTAFPPILKFTDAPFPEMVMKAATGNFTTPTPIQAQSWPIVKADRDMVGIAATGSGKTLAFLVPGFSHVLKVKTRAQPYILVVAPTRELAQQIAKVADQMAGPCGLSSVCIYGGVPKPPQRDALRKGVEIIVATPGRLVDLIEEGAVQLNQVDYLVLDEADRMLDMGFEPSIRAILAKLKPAGQRRTLMFSATWPESIQKLASEFLNKPVCVTIGEAGGTLAATHTVKQIVEITPPQIRDSRVHQLLQEYHDKKKGNRILIFALYKKECQRVSDGLWHKGWNCAAIHGDMTQGAREQAIQDFKDGKVPILVATDVAARGLDVKGITHVINYAFPLTTEDYVHRIGRTGRAGETGVAHTFFQLVADKQRGYELVQVLKEADQHVPPELLKFSSSAKKKEHPLYGSHCSNRFGSADESKKVHITFDDSD